MYKLHVPSPLEQQLRDGAPARRATPLDAFEQARQTMFAGERLELQALADALGVNRVTLHRWVGSRDQLLAEVVWSDVEPLLRQAWARTRTRGGLGIAKALERFLRWTHDHPAVQTFLAREPEAAIRIFTTSKTPFQARLLAQIEALLTEETDAGRLEPPMAIDDLAYVVLRIAESFTYTNIITGREPDPAKAGQAIAALLR